MSVLVTVKLTDREADAVLRSEGFTNGWGVALSLPLQVAQMKIIGAIASGKEETNR